MRDRLRGWWREWRASPRRTLRRWDLERSYYYYAIAMGSAWVGFVTQTWSALTGRSLLPGEARLVAADRAVACLAVALLLTWPAVAYLRRPVRREDEPLPPDLEPGARARAESERAAWGHRGPP